jgi:hypothetical protein
MLHSITAAQLLWYPPLRIYVYLLANKANLFIASRLTYVGCTMALWIYRPAHGAATQFSDSRHVWWHLSILFRICTNENTQWSHVHALSPWAWLQRFEHCWIVKTSSYYFEAEYTNVTFTYTKVYHIHKHICIISNRATDSTITSNRPCAVITSDTWCVSTYTHLCTYVANIVFIAFHAPFYTRAHTTCYYYGLSAAHILLSRQLTNLSNAMLRTRALHNATNEGITQLRVICICAALRSQLFAHSL